MPEIELKPCPFCSSKARIIRYYVPKMAFYPPSSRLSVECVVCGAKSTFYSREGTAVNAWNRRTKYDQDTEFDFIKECIKENDLSYTICLEQLRGLWTAYCLHNRYECDTSSYDHKLDELWTEVCEFDIEWLPDDKSYKGFDLFMGYLLS